jgi:Bacterial regulatory proteins, luxR family
MGKARVAIWTLRDCYASLSRREQQVMALVVSGLLNKQVGGELGISEITVKAHRSNVMARDSRFTSDSRFVNGSLFRRDEPGNIVKPNKSFRAENSANQPEILPGVWAKIVAWRGLPGDDRTDC